MDAFRLKILRINNFDDKKDVLADTLLLSREIDGLSNELIAFANKEKCDVK